MSFVRSAAILAVVLAAAACSDRAKAPEPTAQLRGVAVVRFECPPRPASPTTTGTPIVAVQALRLCPLDAPDGAARAVTVARGEPGFESLVRALSAPDEPPTTGACPEYADQPQVVLARTDDGVYSVAIPTGACGHYQRAALDALGRARGS